MATTSTTTTSLFYSPCSSSSSMNHSPSPPSTLLPFPTPRRRNLPTITATGPDIIGDFGARDPFPAEIESQFGEKVLGNMSTEHKILIPQSSALSLSQQSCVPVSSSDPPLSKNDAKQLLFKLLGWRLREDEEEEEGSKMVMKLHCLWKLKDFESGIELQKRIAKVAEITGHSPVLEQDNNMVTAQLWTPEIGGLSINDFIVAAKIDQLQVSDLLPKKRFWA